MNEWVCLKSWVWETSIFNVSKQKVDCPSDALAKLSFTVVDDAMLPVSWILSIRMWMKFAGKHILDTEDFLNVRETYPYRREYGAF